MDAIMFYEMLERLTALEDKYQKMEALVSAIRNTQEVGKQEILRLLQAKDGQIAYLREHVRGVAEELEHIKKRFIRGDIG